MSGHSKWSTIKRKKGATDAARGKLFSKLSKAILVAVKTGGGTDPTSNHKLRVAIEAAKAANMPKANVDRALAASQAKAGELKEVTYEGFGPAGIAVVLEVATDNRNRTAQEIKGLFERGGGRLAGPGAVSYSFEPKGLLVVGKKGNTQDQILKLIDLGVEDVDETEDGIEVYVEPKKLSETKKSLEMAVFKVLSTELYLKPKTLQTITDRRSVSKALNFLEKLQDHDDVQKVFTNLDIPDEVLISIKHE